MMRLLLTEAKAFAKALTYFTRIPLNFAWIDHSADQLHETTRYLPLVGWLVGGVTALAWSLCAHVFPHPVAVALSMIVSIAVTGAFHEDGLADFCDGFGGGWNKEQVLEIMKDSRIGTYGTVGLVSALGVKFLCLSQLDPQWIPAALLLGHSLSRLASVSIIATQTYARIGDAQAKAQPFAVNLSAKELFVASVFGLSPLFLFSPTTVLVLIPVTAARLFLGRQLHRRIGGYTGDCLGAVQQLTELTIYLFLIATV